MTEQETREAYLAWINDYCNKEFDQEELPCGVKLALDKLVEMHEQSPNVSSESVADLSRAFFSSDIPDNIKALLRPYRKVAW